ncbi:MAG: hypothetical protein ACI9T9_002184 [Oleiphilaceae bacterium]|jgi:hypothetical protein
MLQIADLPLSMLELQKLMVKRLRCLKQLQLHMTEMPIQQRKSPLVCELNIEINIMNIVPNLTDSSAVGSMGMTMGFRYCIHATVLSPLLAYLVRVLGGVSIVDSYRQNKIQLLKIKGACRERR